MGVQEEEFNNSISSFKGADKRLESILVMKDRNVFKDFAHSPSKVIATVKALKNQYQNRKLIALLELHTFSSLNKEFIVEYKDSLKSADIAVLFYDPKAIKNKGLSEIDDKMIKKAFNDNKLIVFSNSGQLSDFLLSQSYVNANLLIMSSGNYASLDLDFITSQIKISE
jgi:UDP-N-acetylmuramate: L-alanyl-gamma-D-glutamyl-meso-diaminopimelate ligase